MFSTAFQVKFEPIPGRSVHGKDSRALAGVNPHSTDQSKFWGYRQPALLVRRRPVAGACLARLRRELHGWTGGGDIHWNGYVLMNDQPAVI
jgi:hypothetical protein